MIHLAFYVPLSHLEKVKESVFDVGAGKIGNYDRCAFETEGTGQFRALTGSSPFLGVKGELEKVREIKVEMVVEDDKIEQVVKALKKAHPYETPAYYAIKVLGY